MEDTSKYLIHAKMTADGIVERNDVVGAVFGQTEGLLGDEFDLRDLQQSSKVGRIDVRVESEGGQSFGDVTIASSLDKVETAILAASLETITRVGPCQARVEVTNIEDVRAAKRRIVIERAKELLAEAFEESVLTSEELHEEVRESVRAGDITRFEGLPAGPNVADSDAIVVVEGRADVLRLLKYGIKNAIAVEGTDVPQVVADLTQDRTVTAFLDGDRGGELILRELAQVGDVDFVAFAPEDRSVEELSHAEVLSALREKTPYAVYAETRASADAETARSVAATDGSATPAPEGDDGHPRTASPASTETPPTQAGSPADGEDADGEPDGTDAALVDHVRESLEDDPSQQSTTRDDAQGTEPDAETAKTDAAETGPASVAAASTAVDDADSNPAVEAGAVDGMESHETATVDELGEADERDDTGENGDETVSDDTDGGETVGDDTDGGETVGDDADSDETAEDDADGEADESTLTSHVREVVGGTTGDARLVDDGFGIVAESDVADAFETVDGVDGAYALVYDGELPQRVLDVAAQRGLEHVVTRETGSFVKQPTRPHVRLADGFLD